MSISPSLLWFMAGFIAGIILILGAAWALLTNTISSADDEYMKDMEHERRF